MSNARQAPGAYSSPGSPAAVLPFDILELVTQSKRAYLTLHSLFPFALHFMPCSPLHVLFMHYA